MAVSGLESLGGGRAPLEMRLATKVAWMYYEESKKQGEIAAELHISQSRVSRLLKSASELGIVRVVVHPPAGVFTELEADIERRYGLEECIVVESRGSEDAIVNDLGLAAATWLSNTVMSDEVIGISSWSATWLAAARSLAPLRHAGARRVVQLIGGVGNPQVQTQATMLLTRLAMVTGAEPTYLQTPGFLADRQTTETLLHDPAVSRVTALWDELTMALVGIGNIDPSPLLQQSGTVLGGVVEEVRAAGGVGDICFRYFDEDGRPIGGDVGGRTLGITVEQLLRVPRRIAAAGGARKAPAIRAALRGGWITTLITDAGVAHELADEPAPAGE